MNPLRILPLTGLLFLLNVESVLTSCSPQSTDDKPAEAFVKSDDPDGLEFWTADTVFNTNPRLVRLFDQLYRYTRADFPDADIQKDIRWMDAFRDSLCVYYKNQHSSNTLSNFVMADSVLSEARHLWALDNDQSTMGSIVNNDVERTRLVFEQFNSFSKLQSLCETPEQKQLLLEEFDAWIKLEQQFSGIFADCVDLEYWGASIGGPIRTAGVLRIWQSHIDLYDLEYKTINPGSDDVWIDNGTFVTPAKSFMLDCIQSAIEEYYCSDCEDNSEEYENMYRGVKAKFSELPQYIDTWVDKRYPWGEEMSSDWSKPEYQRHTAEVLIKLANTISTIR